jgi:hypothetical protein
MNESGATVYEMKALARRIDVWGIEGALGYDEDDYKPAIWVDCKRDAMIVEALNFLADHRENNLPTPTVSPPQSSLASEKEPK